MRSGQLRHIVVGALLNCCCCAIAMADWRGNIGYELTYFPQTSTGVDNWQVNSSIAADVEYYRDMSDNVSLTVNPYVRWDEHDSERTHFDLRELMITTAGDNWEFIGGVNTVFWGVTESRHLVDVINQTDGVDSFDGEQKLGQLMLNLTLNRDSGDYEFYLLPRFRERTFASADGRPFTGIPIDTAAAQYQSGDGADHLDSALRWSRSYDAWDVGLHYFYGTSRDPLLLPQVAANGAVTLIPRYPLLDQAGLDAQAIYGEWLWKAEAVYRRGREIDDHYELVTGFEYTLIGVLSALQEKDIISSDKCQAEDAGFFHRLICNDRMDLGIVVELLWDERGQQATHPFQRDMLAGFRFALNDERSTDALVGVIQDLDGGATTLSLEASTRVFDSFRLSVEARAFANTNDDPILAPFENESFLRLGFNYFF